MTFAAAAEQHPRRGIRVPRLPHRRPVRRRGSRCRDVREGVPALAALRSRPVARRASRCARSRARRPSTGSAAERRRRSRENVYALREVETPASRSFGEGLPPRLERALAALSPGEREVIALRVLLELEGRPRRVCSGSARPRARRGSRARSRSWSGRWPRMLPELLRRREARRLARRCASVCVLIAAAEPSSAPSCRAAGSRSAAASPSCWSPPSRASPSASPAAARVGARAEPVDERAVVAARGSASPRLCSPAPRAASRTIEPTCELQVPKRPRSPTDEARDADRPAARRRRVEGRSQHAGPQWQRARSSSGCPSAASRSDRRAERARAHRRASTS